MPAIPNPWLILGAFAAVVFAALGGFFYGQHVESLSWEAAIAVQKSEAADILAKHEARMSALNLEIEHAHAQRQAALAYRADDTRRLVDELDRLRHSRRGACGGNQVQPAAGPAVAQPAPDTAGTDPGSFQVLARIAEDAVATAEYAAACRAWVEVVAK